MVLATLLYSMFLVDNQLWIIASVNSVSNTFQLTNHRNLVRKHPTDFGFSPFDINYLEAKIQICDTTRMPMASQNVHCVKNQPCNYWIAVLIRISAIYVATVYINYQTTYTLHVVQLRSYAHSFFCCFSNKSIYVAS